MDRGILGVSRRGTGMTSRGILGEWSRGMRGRGLIGASEKGRDMQGRGTGGDRVRG